jgi:hypothetical protein
VLLAATIGLFYYLKHPVINVQYAANEGFYSVFHICASPSVYAPYRSKKTPPRMQITSTVQDPIPFCRGNTLEALSSIVNS